MTPQLAAVSLARKRNPVRWPVKILYVIDSTKVGGAETLLLGLLQAARDRGHEPHLAWFSEGPLGPEMARLAASSTRLGRRGLRDPAALWRAVRLMRRLRPDVVHTHLLKSDLVGQVAARLCRVPLRIVTLHNTDPWRRQALPALVYRLATGGAHRLVAVSEAVAAHLRQTRSGRADRLTVIPNGIDLARFGAVAALEPARDGSLKVFACIGRLHPQKDHASFLAAAALLAHRKDVAFHIIGDGPLRASLEDRTQALGLVERVRFTGIEADVAGVLAGVEGVVLASVWEGLPLVVIEAMAAARPVIATAVGEVPQVLRDGIDGRVVPPGAPEALAAAMAELLDQPDLARAMGLAGRERARALYDQSAMHARLFALYDQPPERTR